MKCEKSYKRVRITRWGIQMAAMFPIDEVKAKMRKASRLSLAELESGLEKLGRELVSSKVAFLVGDKP